MTVWIIQSKSTKNVIAVYTSGSLAYKMWHDTRYDIISMETS